MKTNTPLILELPMSRVAPDPEQPRKHFDVEELRGLADSIESQGLLQPITVRTVGSNGSTTFVIIAGERRWRAHGLLKKETILAMVKDGLNEEQLRNTQALENLARSNMLPTEEATAVDRGIRQGQTYEELAKSFGRSAQSLMDLHAILALPGPVLKQVDDGIYALSVAKLIAKFPERLFLEAYERTTGMTVDQAKKVLHIMAIEHKQMDIFTLSPEQIAERNNVAQHLWILRSAATTFFGHSPESLALALRAPDVRVLKELRDEAEALLQALAAVAPAPKAVKPQFKTYDIGALRPVVDGWWKGKRLADLARPLGLTRHQLLGQFWATGLIPRPKPGKRAEYDAALAAANPYRKKTDQKMKGTP